MKRNLFLVLAGVVAVPILAGCAATPSAPEPARSTPGPPPAAPSPTLSGVPAEAADAGIRIRFRVADAQILVIPADNPTARSFIASLPLTVSFEEFAGNEKISYLTDRLETAGSPGSRPAAGDLGYYVPWGNIAFFYVDGGGYSDDVKPIGTIESGIEHISLLETGDVTVDLAP